MTLETKRGQELQRHIDNEEKTRAARHIDLSNEERTRAARHIDLRNEEDKSCKAH